MTQEYDDAFCCGYDEDAIYSHPPVKPTVTFSPENIRKATRIFSEFVESTDLFCCGEMNEEDAMQKIIDALLGKEP